MELHHNIIIIIIIIVIIIVIVIIIIIVIVIVIIIIIIFIVIVIIIFIIIIIISWWDNKNTSNIIRYLEAGLSSLFFPHLKGVKLGAGKIPAAILLPLGNPKPLFKGPRVPHDPGHGAKHGPSSPQDPRFPGFPMAPAGGKMCCTGPVGLGPWLHAGLGQSPVQERSRKRGSSWRSYAMVQMN